MFSLRTKFILFMSILIIIIGILSCLFFLVHSKRQQESALKKLGTSLVMLFAQDNEVKLALSYTQPAFMDAPIKRIQALDREDEIGYWRISDTQLVMFEEKAPWVNIDMKDIPAGKNSHNQEAPLTDHMINCSGETFYDFSIPIFEKQTFSEEEFAAQILGVEEAPEEMTQKILGFVQIGLSPRKLNERIHRIIWQSIVPMGLLVVLGGITMTFFLTNYCSSSLRHIANVTLDIAKGNLTRTVDISSKDEIGQLAINFNQMTRALKTSYDEKEKIMNQLREHVDNLSNANKELVKINEQLNEAQERLVRSEKLAVIGKLASGVGHELRNPLGAIKNTLYILKKRFANSGIATDPEKLSQLLEVIDKETERSIKTVNDLLGFSRTTKPKVSPTHIHSLVESSLSRIKIPEKIQMVLQIKDPLPLISVDATQIEQVFINLVQNACDAMPLGGLLIIKAQNEDDFLTITFTDTGCGIPDTVQKNLFDPLFTTKPKGLGLGLAISSSIIQRHEGYIDFKSKVGEGTSFIVKLPVAEG